MANQYGLQRNIPDPIKREIRQRSKFACVVCRSGIFDYEHIEPEYKDAKAHEADKICCLCSSCHDKVTRRHYSKAFIRQKYLECENADPKDVSPPFDSLDFHDGNAELKVGGITYAPGVRCILKYHGVEIISVAPSNGETAGGINAMFFDSEGQHTLRIEDNVWTGAIDAWDTEVVGPRISVRKRQGSFALKLRLEPPGRIVIERLDMRFKDAHVLVSEHSHALGRYVTDDHIRWLHANMVSMGSPQPGASAIEYLTPFEAEWRDQKWIGKGQRLATQNNQMVMQSGLGVTCKPMGIIVGAQCLKFSQGSFAVGGPRPLTKMRRYVFSKPEKVAEFIGTGDIKKEYREHTGRYRLSR